MLSLHVTVSHGIEMSTNHYNKNDEVVLYTTCINVVNLDKMNMIPGKALSK